MRRIIAVFTMAVFAVVLGCGDEPDPIGNQGGGGGGNNAVNGGAGGYDIVRSSDDECFEFEDFGAGDTDEPSDFWSYTDMVEMFSGPTQAFGAPRCLSDSGLGLIDDCGGQEQYHWACIEYRDWRNQADTLDDYTKEEPCLWKTVADNIDGTCQYEMRCVPKRAWRGVESHDGDFPDRWDDAIDLHCLDWMGYGVPRFDAERIELEESVAVGSSTDIQIEVKNVGHATLEIWDVSLPLPAADGPFFPGDGWPEGEVDIEPGEAYQFYLTFSPDEVGNFTVNVSMSTNDDETISERPSVRVDAVAH